MKYIIENPCLWCEVDLKMLAEHQPEGFDIIKEFGPELIALHRAHRTSLGERHAIQCNNCGLITPGAETPELAWKYWNDGGHK